MKSFWIKKTTKEKMVFVCFLFVFSFLIEQKEKKIIMEWMNEWMNEWYEKLENKKKKKQGK